VKKQKNYEGEISHLEVNAFGVINTGCGDEWLAGDASVACWVDDERL